MSRKKAGRLHFGVLFSTFDNTCQFDVWKGIVEYAKMSDIHLTAYIGTYQTTDHDFASHLGTCIETISNSTSLDGVILFSGFLAEHIGIDAFEELVAGLPVHIPVVSVSYAMPGVPSVLVDNISGIYNAVEHLIQVHGKKNIAFVKGPEGHQEAEDRLAGYKKALAANGLAFDEKYVLPGHFSQECGRDAVVELLDNRKLPADAIVASDDESAVGVLNELKLRNIIVPTDIAVTGFDDDRASATFIPSISTAQQGFFDIGLVSAETLYQQVEGNPVEDVAYVTPVFIARQSCGCFEQDLANADLARVYIPDETDSLVSFAFRGIAPFFRYSVPQHLIHEWAMALAEKIKDKPFNKDSFLHLLDEILIKYNHYSNDFTIWFEVLDILASSVELYNEEVECVQTALSTLFLSTRLIYDIRRKEERNKEFLLNDEHMLLRRITSAIFLSNDIESLSNELYKSLPELFINTLLIGLYRDHVKNDEPKADRTIDTLIGFDGEKRFNMKHNSSAPILFSDYSTIDNFDFEQKQHSLLFIPLFTKDEEMGVLLLPYDPRISVETYETLRICISITVKDVELLTKIQTLSITDELSGLLNRRGFFQFVYSRLPHLSRNTERMPIVLFLDMDGLKYINDTYGHKEGDIAISAFSQSIKEALREEDILGRLGGDEFAVFSSVKSEEDSKQLEKRIREKLYEYNSKELHPYRVSGSIGSVLLDTATKECFEAAMLSADNVLYEEKAEKKRKGLSRQ